MAANPAEELWAGGGKAREEPSGGLGVEEVGLEGGIVGGGENLRLEEVAVVEVVGENEGAGGARPPRLIEEEVAEAVVDGAVAVEFEGLGLVGGGADDEVGAEVDQVAEEADLVAGAGVGEVAG